MYPIQSSVGVVTHLPKVNIEMESEETMFRLRLHLVLKTLFNPYGILNYVYQ
jgi:hypothetical protein